MKGGSMKPLSTELEVELRALEAMPDSEIDTSDMPEVKDWSGARRGLFFKPVKQLHSLRIDNDVWAFYQAKGKGYQTHINDLLRAEMEREQAAEVEK
jgi:uncharacterized protein (DUF4415 family)